MGRGLAVGHLVDDRQDLVDRDREAEADRAARAVGSVAGGADRGVDADDVAVEVDQRAAAVAGVDRRVGLDGRVVVLLPSPSEPTLTGRFSALTMPLVTVDSRPNGEPIATTPWPTSRSPDLPMRGRGEARDVLGLDHGGVGEGVGAEDRRRGVACRR